jgi:hypothetical protein
MTPCPVLKTVVTGVSEGLAAIICKVQFVARRLKCLYLEDGGRKPLRNVSNIDNTARHHIPEDLTSHNTELIVQIV